MNEPGKHMCPRCTLGEHQRCSGTVLVDETDNGETIWEECACHARAHRPATE